MYSIASNRFHVKCFCHYPVSSCTYHIIASIPIHRIIYCTVHIIASIRSQNVTFIPINRKSITCMKRHLNEMKFYYNLLFFLNIYFLFYADIWNHRIRFSATILIVLILFATSRILPANICLAPSGCIAWIFNML